MGETREELARRFARLTRLRLDEWRRIIPSLDLEDLRTAADRLRARLCPDGVVTYLVDRNINYSNICVSRCGFCAFSRGPGDPDGFLLDCEAIRRKVEEMLDLGGSGILLQGGIHPHLDLEYYTGLLRDLKERYRIHLHCFSPPEILGMARRSGLSVDRVLEELRSAGLDSLPGGGAEILVDEVRKRLRGVCTAREWLEVMETAHRKGIPATATMVLGLGETDDHRLEHLEAIRSLQDRTGGFVAFIPWTFQPEHTSLGRTVKNRVSDETYLRWLAIARLYLDNVPNVQVSWLTHGLDAGRRGLHRGANDLGSVMIEEKVLAAAGAGHRATEGMLREAILEEGFIPCRRNAAYVRIEGHPLPSGRAP